MRLLNPTYKKIVELSNLNISTCVNYNDILGLPFSRKQRKKWNEFDDSDIDALKGNLPEDCFNYVIKNSYKAQ
jgi:hypothetical protein